MGGGGGGVHIHAQEKYLGFIYDAYIKMYF